MTKMTKSLAVISMLLLAAACGSTDTGNMSSSSSMGRDAGYGPERSIRCSGFKNGHAVAASPFGFPQGSDHGW